MLVSITLAEAVAQRLLQSITNLITEVEAQGGDASHYQALVAALRDVKPLDRESDNSGV